MKRKLKRIVLRLLCLLMSTALLGFPPAFGEEREELPAPAERQISISNTKQFLRFAQRCILDRYSKNLKVTLKADLNLAGTDFNGIPVFFGEFDGAGYTIEGLSLQPVGSEQGLFRYLGRGAVVHDLKLKGEIRPDGSRCRVGAIVGSNAGTIRNCQAEIEVSGAEMTGGLVGENDITGVIQSCTVSGKVTGSHFVGGVAGNNLGVILDCRNKADINISPEENKVELREITKESLAGSEAVNTTTDVGGIAGSSQGVIRRCRNYGTIGYRQMGYNIGGIAGTQKGYIADCENHAPISGRKEVGGIVGQMEPVAYVAFEEDALQILNQQLDGLSAIVGQAANSTQMATGAIGGQMTVLITQMGDTGKAVKALMEEEGLSPDTMQAAKNVLSSGVSDMTQTMAGLAATTQSAMGVLSNSIYAMQGQINAMRTTLGNISETMGGALKDLSDQDTPEQHNGKVENCRNEGKISGDLHVGGITGLIAPENDLDIREDYTLGENNSLNFVSELRAVILACDNQGDISVKRESGGGIVGRMLLGLVKDSRSTGLVKGENASYLGGIAGNSKSFLRNNSAKCCVEGDSYIGGIAGEGSTVSGCRSMVQLTGRERVGAVLGYGRQDTDDEGKQKLWENYYLQMKQDPGGIDGISYESVAQPLDESRFYSQEELPALFSETVLYFEQEDGKIQTLTLQRGETPDLKRIPKVKEKAGYVACWKDFEAIPYAFSVRFVPQYTPMSATIATAQEGRAGMPLLLAEGNFLPDTCLEYVPSALAPSLPPNEELLVSAFYSTDDGGRAERIRFYIGQTTERVKAYAHLPGGGWQELPCQVLGSYAALTLPENADCFAISRVCVEIMQLIILTAGILLLGGTGTVLIVKGKKRKKEKNRVR